MFCVFGVNPRFPTSCSRILPHPRAGNVVELVVAKGAGVLPPSNHHNQGRPWNVASSGTVEDPTMTFRLVLRDPVPTPLTVSTIDFILEHLEVSRAATIEMGEDEPHLDLQCSPAVFASFISLVSIGRPAPDGAD
jgi:hypothetical protein